MRYRLATLAAALVVAAPALAQEAGPQAPEAIVIDAEAIEGVTGLEVTARGDAEIRRGDFSIFGDLLRYNREFGRVEAQGGVRLQSGADRFFGSQLQYSTLDDTGVLEEPGFLLQRDRLARGAAERLEILGRNRYRMANATFTTCRPGQDDWRLEAAVLDLDYEREEGYAESPRLRFFGVPILGAPFASFPLENRRKSGLLTPYYAQTTTRGLEFGIPYYWNIAPERDLTLTPVYMGKRGLQLKNHLRYLDRRHAGELKLEYLPDDRDFGEARTGLSLQHAHRFGHSLNAHLDYNTVSDDRYFVDLASQVKQVSLTNLPQDGVLTYSGSLGRAPYSLQARVQRFQTLQDPLAPIVPPYHRVPQLSFSTAFNELGGLLDSALPLEYARFTHPTLVEGSRVSFSPTLAAPFVFPSWHLTPRAGVRYASYSLGPLAASRSPELSVPWFSLDSGVNFERDARWFGESLTQTLEPRLFYVYAPYREQSHIPLFDTALADFNYPQLFTENRFVGGDRFGDADQATLALTSRFLQANGQEAFRATVGQRYYFQDERVRLTPGSPLRESAESDMLAAVGGRLFRNWTFDAATQYDRLAQRPERYSMSMRYTPEIAKVLNASYRYNRGENIRQIDLSGQWPITAGWYAVGRYNYSLLDRRLLEGLAGVEYNAGCWVFRGVVQRIQAAAEVSSTAVVFQLEFNGVGQIGTDQAVELLKRNVPGYSVTNPADPRLAPPGAGARLPFEQVY
jgi:LPS-assembly protein